MRLLTESYSLSFSPSGAVF